MSTAEPIQFSEIAEIHRCHRYIGVTDGRLRGMNGTFEVFGGRVKLLRDRREMTQTQLAEAMASSPFRVQVKQSTLSGYENSGGDEMPSVPVLAALAYVLETNADYLLGLTDDDRPASDLDDQVVVAVTDPLERSAIQEIMDALVRAPSSDKQFLAEMIRRVLPKPPRIIGGAGPKTTGKE